MAPFREAELIAHRAALPSPARFKHELPASIWQKWEYGELGTRAEWWAYVERLCGPEYVARLLGVASEARAV